MFELTLIPAYGRDYKTAEAMKKDWIGGKDFQIQTIVSPDNGRYCSIRDVKLFPGKHVKIRYNKLRDSVLYNLVTGVMKDEEGKNV